MNYGVEAPKRELWWANSSTRRWEKDRSFEIPLKPYVFEFPSAKSIFLFPNVSAHKGFYRKQRD